MKSLIAGLFAPLEQAIPIDQLRAHGGTVRIELRDDNDQTTAVETIPTTEAADVLVGLVALLLAAGNDDDPQTDTA
jgi:hypothetical protein